MSIGAIPPIAGPAAAAAAPATAAPGFATSISKALEAVSAAEGQADAIAQDIASGGEAEVHDLMVAMTKASLSVEMLSQARNRAVEAYQEIMRMQL